MADKTVRLECWKHWISTSGRTSELIPWRDNLTALEIVPEEMRGEKGLQVCLNGIPISYPHSVLLRPGDTVSAAVRPADPYTASILAQVAVAAVVSFAVSLVINLILGKPKGPKKKGDDESANFGFSGFQNLRTEGQPRMVIYGHCRVAPQVIDEFTETRNIPAETDYLALHSFGEGPIYAIGQYTADNPDGVPLSSEDAASPLPTGTLINGNKLTNLDGVFMHVRMGTNEQSAIPGFEFIDTDYSVGATLTEQETTQAGNSGLNAAVDPALVAYNADNSLPTSGEALAAQAVWDAHSFSFDLTADADAATILMNFPGGLYTQNTSGNLADASFRMAIRYKELDGSGNPINTGGDRGNGWVYIYPADALVARQQSPFSYEYPITFANPATYVAPTLGRALDATLTNRYAATGTLNPANLPSSWASAGIIDGFTIEGWVQWWQLPVVTTAGAVSRPIFEWSDAASPTTRGIGLALVSVLRDNGQTTDYKWIPQLTTGTAAGLLRTQETPLGGLYSPPSLHYTVTENPSGLTNWYYVVATYEKDPYTSVKGRFRVYLNGQLTTERRVGTNSAGHVLGCAPNPFEMMRSLRFVGGGTRYGLGALDEFRVWDRALTALEITTQYNAGRGLSGVSNSNLVAAYHFDAVGSPTADYGPRANNATLTGGATAGSFAGRVDLPSVSTPKRSKYRVCALRLNIKSTSQRVQDESVWETLFGKLDEKLAYPNTALAGLKVRATEQLNTTAPVTTYMVKGRLVPFWDGLSLSNPAIIDTWAGDGTRPPPGRNPAWITLDVAMNTRYGRGGTFPLQRVDLQSFKELADYCDTLVYDGKGYRQGIHETTGTFPIADMQYSSTLFGAGLPGLIILFRSGFTPPPTWAVGGYVGFTDVPVGSGITADINTSNIDGFEIVSMVNVGAWQVSVKYDAATYGDPWLDGAFVSAQYSGTVTGTCEGREPRYQYDKVHDTFDKAWDTMIAILSTCRAMPMMDGNILRVKYERPRSPVSMITMANTMTSGDTEKLVSSFELEYVGNFDRPNALQADFQDRDQDFAKSLATWDDPSLTAGAPEEAARRENITIEGITRRSQLVRHLKFICNVNRLLTKVGRFDCGLDALALEAGDVAVIAHDLVPWGRSARIASGLSATQVTLDREVTIPASPASFLRVRSNASGQTGSGTSVADTIPTLAVTTAAGTYAAGSTITVSGGFDFVPQKGDLYSLYQTQALAQVTEISLSPDFKRHVEWIKYDDDVYDDELTVDVPVNILAGDPPVTEKTIPLPALELTVDEVMPRRSDGGHDTELLVSWRHDPATAGFVARSILYVKAGSDWQQIGIAEGPGTSLRVRMNELAPGDSVEIAVQAVSRGGARIRPERCARALRTIGGTSLAPSAPTNLRAVMNGDLVTYLFDPPADSRGYTYELRRGGWILGQVVGTAPAGMSSIGPTADWVGGENDAAGLGVAPLLLRARDSRGQYSAAAILEGFNPSPQGAGVLEEFAWEDVSPAWFAISPPIGDPSGVGLQVTTYAGRDCVEFDPVSLSGIYKTGGNGYSLKIQQPIAERLFVEAFLVADQVPPLTVDEWILPLEHPAASRRSIEGMMDVREGETANCSLEIQFRYSASGISGDWQTYRPQIVFADAVEFRLVMTRPSLSYQIRVYQFHTRLTRIPKQRRERSPSKVYGLGRIMARG